VTQAATNKATAIARANLPPQRLSPGLAASRGRFAALLQQATQASSPRPTVASPSSASSALPAPLARTTAASGLRSAPLTPISLTPTSLSVAHSNRLAAKATPRPIASARPVTAQTQLASADGPKPLARSEMLQKAGDLLNIPYVWGGNTESGLDCSAYVSKVWGVGRQTTDTLHTVARPIAKDELLPGDALNQTMAEDPRGAGHVRLFDGWANAERTRMWVYEETMPKSLHRVIDWDPRYTPMRRLNTVSDVGLTPSRA
jgi:cell wall-associated NlpC family hydrolase